MQKEIYMCVVIHFAYFIHIIYVHICYTKMVDKRGCSCTAWNSYFTKLHIYLVICMLNYLFIHLVIYLPTYCFMYLLGYLFIGLCQKKTGIGSRKKTV